MPAYLDEEQLGSDDIIGFPHLLLCMGVVVVTPDGMHGMHFTNRGRTEAVVGYLAEYLRSNGVTGAEDMIDLYGSGNFKIRYGGGGKNAWKEEMRLIAGAIGYQGKARGFDTSIIKPADGTYVEYHRDPLRNKIKIFYKRNEKMDFTRDGGLHPTMVNKGGLGPSRLAGTSSAAVKVTRSNKGQLHEVNYWLRLTDFTI